MGENASVLDGVAVGDADTAGVVAGDGRNRGSLSVADRGSDKDSDRVVMCQLRPEA